MFILRHSVVYHIEESGVKDAYMKFGCTNRMKMMGHRDQMHTLYTVFKKKIDHLLFHHIFALTATSCKTISRSTYEVLLVVITE